MNFRGFGISPSSNGISRGNQWRLLIARTHVPSLREAPSFFDRGRGFFSGGVPAFRTSVFSRVIRLIMFYYRVERFVRSNHFKIREWKIDEIEAIFTPRLPRPLLRLDVDKIDFFFIIQFIDKAIFLFLHECLVVLCIF